MVCVDISIPAGVIVALVYIIVCLPRSHGSPPSITPTFYPFMYKGMIIIHINQENAIHVHHWMVLAPILICYQYINIGLWIGCLLVILHGLTYKDALCVRVVNPYSDACPIKCSPEMCVTVCI
jgi:hypothetical protein